MIIITMITMTIIILYVKYNINNRARVMFIYQMTMY